MAVLELEIFKAGDYGDKGKYSEQDIEQIAKDYDGKIHEAPVTVDHKQTGPAYGWVESLKSVGGKLIASLKDMQPAFMEAVQKGLYKKRSIELYKSFKDTGRAYLRALTFLGAQVPEVKGLSDPMFKDEGAFESFEDEHGQAQTDTDTHGQDSTPNEKVYSQIEEKIHQFSDKLNELENKINTIPKGEKVMPEEIKTPEPITQETPVVDVKTFSEADVAAMLEAERAKIKAESEQHIQAVLAKEKAVSGFAAFCEKQKTEGKLTKAQQDLAIAIHGGLVDESKTVKFSEGGKESEVPLTDMLTKLIDSLPAQVEFREIVKDGEKRTITQYGENVDQESIALNEKAKVIFAEAQGQKTYREALLEAAEK